MVTAQELASRRTELESAAARIQAQRFRQSRAALSSDRTARVRAIEKFQREQAAAQAQIREAVKEQASIEAQFRAQQGAQAAQSRRDWLTAEINKRLRGQDYASSAPKGLSRAEQKRWNQAMAMGASRSVYAGKYGLYPTGEIKYKVGEELVPSFKVSDIPRIKLKLEPQLVQVGKPRPTVTFGKEAWEDVQKRIEVGDIELKEQLAGRGIQTISYEPKIVGYVKGTTIPITGIEYEKPKISEPTTAWKRYKEATKDYSLLAPISKTKVAGVGIIPSAYAPSVSGTIDWLAGEVSRMGTGEQIRVTKEDIPAYKLRGTISPEKPIMSLLTKKEIKEIKERKLVESRKTAYTLTQLAPYVALAPVAPGAASGLLFTTSAEKYFTPTGRKKIKESAKVIGPTAYALPAAGLALGAYGIRQAFIKRQVTALRAAKPEITGGTPIEVKKQLYLKQISESRIPYPGFKYKAVPFASETISPKLTTISLSKLTPEKGGFIFVGKAESMAGVVGITKPIVIKTGAFSEMGKVLPAKAARFVKAKAGVKLTKEIKTAYGGRIIAETTPIKKDYFGGFKVRELKGKDIIVSGPVSKERIFESFVRVKAEPKTFGMVIPKKELTRTIIVGGKKAQMSFLPRLGQKSITDYFIPYPSHKIKTLEVPATIVGQRIDVLGKSVLSVKVKTIPAVSVGFPRLKQVSVPLQIPTVTQVEETIQTPEQIEVTKTIQTPKTIQFQSPIQFQAPKQIQIPTQLQVPKQIIIPRPTGVTTQIPRIPIIPTGGLIPLGTTPIKLTPSLIGKIKQAYEVKVRREGVFRTIAKGLPKGKALKFGAKRVTQTLAATFKLVPKGFTTKRDVKYKPSPLRFRKPKSGEKLTYVELKTKRIKKGTGEISEILKIRGSKPWKTGKRKKGRRKKLL